MIGLTALSHPKKTSHGFDCCKQKKKYNHFFFLHLCRPAGDKCKTVSMSHENIFFLSKKVAVGG
jgi:hypothetical protein